MEQETIKSDLNNAVCEMNLLYASRQTTFAPSSLTTPPPSLATTDDSDGIAGGRFVRYHRHHSVAPTLSMRPVFSLTTTVQMNLNPRYISKVATTSTKISNSPRKMFDSSLRMRPYFVPERSRTKSENAVEPLDVASFSPAAVASSNSVDQYFPGGKGTGEAIEVESLCGVGLHAAAAAPNAMDTSCDGLFEMNGNTVVASVGVESMIGGVAKTIGKQNDGGQILLKKSKSLEDVSSTGGRRGRNTVDGSQPSHEMEFVSNRIQKLKVQD